ncbi:MAG: hypothetical protein KAT86_06485, partial [Candidatus Latescibacteria bacterium]|nr:hypothetical protein [Candidatus Latescibacterota bacterium]
MGKKRLRGVYNRKSDPLGLRWPLPGLSFLVLSLMFSVSAAQGVKVLKCDDAGIVLSYQPGELTRRTVDTDSGEAEILQLSDCGTTDKVGYPMLPKKSVLVGVPLEVELRLQIISSRSVVQRGYSVAPVPQLVGKKRDGEIFSEEHFVRDPQAYSGTFFSPSQVAALGKPGFLRDQRVVDIVFWPVRYNPVRQEIERYEEIVIKLLFSPPARRTGFLELPLNEENEDFYRQVLVNYQLARKWRLQAAQRRLLVDEVSFPSGEYLKINVKTDGIYCLRWNDLKKAGIDLDQFDPRTIKMYYGGGRELPRDPSVPPPQWQQIPIVVDTTSNYILFYGNGLSGWDYDKQEREFTHFINHYTRQNCYWLTLEGIEPGKRMACRDGIPGRKEVFSPQGFRARIHQETERYCTWADETGGSGIEWYWDTLSWESGKKRYPFLTFYPDTADTCLIKIKLLGAEFQEYPTEEHRSQISLNGEIIGEVSFSGFCGSSVISTLETIDLLETGNNSLGIEELP